MQSDEMYVLLLFHRISVGSLAEYGSDAKFRKLSGRQTSHQSCCVDEKARHGLDDLLIVPLQKVCSVTQVRQNLRGVLKSAYGIHDIRLELMGSNIWASILLGCTCC